METPSNLRSAACVAVLLLGASGALGACGDGSDPEEQGPQSQAVEQLRDLGLDEDVAECVVDEIGAEAVVEASDLNAFTESQQYRDAAEGCTDG